MGTASPRGSEFLTELFGDEPEGASWVPASARAVSHHPGSVRSTLTGMVLAATLVLLPEREREFSPGADRPHPIVQTFAAAPPDEQLITLSVPSGP